MAEYIEREALIQHMQECKGDSVFNIMATGYAYAFIKRAPAADVVEVKHGHWIITKEALTTIRECSCCHCKTFCPNTMIFNLRKAPYCEDCGAKMDDEMSVKQNE